MEQRKINITFIKSASQLFHLALPMIVTQLITVVSGFAAMLMLAHLGQEVLAASALIFSTRVTLLIIGSSILFSLSFLIGHALGEKNFKGIGELARQGWLLSILLSIPIVIIYFNIEKIFIFLGQDKEIAHINQIFFLKASFGVLPFLLSITNQQLCYGTQKPRIDLYGNILGVAVLMATSYILIFGKFGFNELGVAGLGYAVSIQCWVYFIFTTWCIYKWVHFSPFELFKLRGNFSYLSKIINLGWPISLQISGEMLSFFVTATMVGWLGTSSLGAYQVVTQYTFLVIVPIFALSQASGILVGKAIGDQKPNEISKIGSASILMATLFSGLFACLFVLLPKQLASWYFNVNLQVNNEMLHYTINLFYIVAATQVFDAIRNVLTGSLRGMFDTQFPMLVGLVMIWLVGLPLGYFLGFKLKYGLQGIAIGSCFAMLICSIILIKRWRYKVYAF
jgi:MATE family multidrug resistance protein